MLYTLEFEDIMKIISHEQCPNYWVSRSEVNQRKILVEDIDYTKQNQKCIPRDYYDSSLGFCDDAANKEKRPQIGFVTSGYYCMDKGLSRGLGYIDAAQYEVLCKIWREFLVFFESKKFGFKVSRNIKLSDMVHRWECVALFRSPGSLNYHFLIIKK